MLEVVLSYGWSVLITLQWISLGVLVASFLMLLWCIDRHQTYADFLAKVLTASTIFLVFSPNKKTWDLLTAYLLGN